MMGQLVGMASLAVRWARTRQRVLPPHVWLANEQDQKAIGEPLARIAARHAPVTGKGSDDVVDGLATVVATSAYAMRNLEVEATIEHVELVDQLDPLDQPPPADGPAGPMPNGAMP